MATREEVRRKRKARLHLEFEVVPWNASCKVYKDLSYKEVMEIPREVDLCVSRELLNHPDTPLSVKVMLATTARCQAFDGDLIRGLLAKITDEEKRYKLLKTAFWLCCVGSGKERAELLSEIIDADPCFAHVPMNDWYSRADSFKALVQTCGTGKVETLEWLVTKFGLTKYDLKANDNYALRYACICGNLSAVKWLVERAELIEQDVRCRNNVVLRWGWYSHCAREREVVSWIVWRFDLRVTWECTRPEADELAKP